MKRRWIMFVLLGGGVLILAIAALGLWLAWPDLTHTEVAQTQPLPASSALLERGRYLALAGDCVACHTAQGGTQFAGGRRIRTPFGSVFTSNLTPDINTGIGSWSAGDFWRALHFGKAKDGRLLYPVFPYPNYTRVTRADSDAIYAYLQSLPPVEQRNKANELRFPYNTQASLVVWRALFFKPAEFEPRSDRSNAWNRGAYLVEGLGHCNACHTARGILGQTLIDRDYEGGPIPAQRWNALSLRQAHTINDEQAAEMAELLKSGTSAKNAMTGPMAEVVFNSLQYLTQTDINAMVTYIRSLPVTENAASFTGTRMSPGHRKALIKQGAEIYKKHCAECHGDNGEGEAYKYPALAGNRLVTANSPSNAIRTVMAGGFAPSTQANPRPYGMPPYAQQLSAQEVASVLTYIRNAWGNKASAVVPKDITRN